MLRHMVFLDLGTDELLRDVLPHLDQMLLLVPHFDIDLAREKLVGSSFPLVLSVSDCNLLPVPLIFLFSLEALLITEANLANERGIFS